MEHQAILKTLLDELATATEMARVANERFQMVIKEAPSGFPHPDGIQRIHNVSAENAKARRNLHDARVRLEQFRAYGYVPKDLR